MNIIRALYAGAIIAVILAITATHSSKAHSSEIELILGAKSVHLATEPDNEDHNLVCVKYEPYVGCRFLNSYERNSLLAAKSFGNIDGDVKYGVIVGLVTGYSRDSGDPFPVFIPYVTSTYAYGPIVLMLGDAVVLSFKMEL
jgi:hypothetical protein